MFDNDDDFEPVSDYEFENTFYDDGTPEPPKDIVYHLVSTISSDRNLVVDDIDQYGQEIEADLYKPFKVSLVQIEKTQGSDFNVEAYLSKYIQNPEDTILLSGITPL